MNLLEYLIQTIPREIDYPFSLGELYFFVGFFIIIEALTLVVIFFAYLKIKDLESQRVTGRAFFISTIGLFVIPLGRILDFSYRIITGNTRAIFVGNTNIFYAAGALTFIVFYSFYVQNIINLSKFVQKIYKGMTLITSVIGIGVICIQLIHLIYPLNDKLVTLVFVLIALILALTISLPMIFSLKDFFRISNKLTKVRLGMIIITGVFFLIQWCSVALYLILVLAGTISILIPLSVLSSYGEGFYAALILYWGFFIPQKLQEWTGILPPSFKLMKEKQRQLAKMTHNST